MVKNRCPDIDVLGVNAYGSIEKLPLNIRRYGWNKPYIVTEWGVTGHSKLLPHLGERRRTTRRGQGLYTVEALRRHHRCRFEHVPWELLLFMGPKTESTATWHDLFLSDGSATDGVDAMHKAWSGEWPTWRAPSIRNIRMNDRGWKIDHIVEPDSEVQVDVDLKASRVKSMAMRIVS